MTKIKIKIFKVLAFATCILRKLKKKKNLRSSLLHYISWKKIFKALAFSFYILKKFKIFMCLLSNFSYILKKFKKQILIYFLLFLILEKIQKIFIIIKNVFIKTNISSMQLITWINNFFYGNNFHIFFMFFLSLFSYGIFSFQMLA